MNIRALLMILAVGFGIVAWQTQQYPPDYLLAAWLWSVMSAVGSVFCLATLVSVSHGVTLVAGVACVCTAIGRASAIVFQLAFQNTYGLGAPFANYVISATVWSIIAALIFFVWSHYVIPWTTLRRGSRG